MKTKLIEFSVAVCGRTGAGTVQGCLLTLRTLKIIAAWQWKLRLLADFTEYSEQPNCVHYKEISVHYWRKKNCILHYFVRRGVGHLCLIIKWTDQQMDLKRRPSFYTKMQSLFHAFGSKDAKSLYNCLNSFFRNPQSKTLSLNNSTSISLMFGSWRFLCW